MKWWVVVKVDDCNGHLRIVAAETEADARRLICGEYDYMVDYSHELVLPDLSRKRKPFILI